MATVKESHTGVLFPSSFSPPGVSTALDVLGVGLREKKVVLVNVKVYAVACHVDKAGASSALAQFKDKAKLEGDQAFFDAIRDGPFDLSLSLCFARDLSHDQFAKGINEALEPRLKERKAPESTLKEFVDALAVGTYTKDSRLFLVLKHPSTLTISGVKAADVPADLTLPEGVKTATVESEALCAALRDVYFGKDTVSPSLKQGVAQAAPAFLK